MTEVDSDVSEAHACFKQMFLRTPAALAPYIKYEFSACECGEKTVDCVHKLGREKNKVIFETIYQHYLFISILNTAKKRYTYTQVTLILVLT